MTETHSSTTALIARRVPSPAGSRTCSLCEAGYVTGPLPGGDSEANRGASACVPCGPRTFRPSIYAANQCILCPQGRETKKADGATACTACAPGTSLLLPTDVNCTACSAGEAREKGGQQTHPLYGAALHRDGTPCACQHLPRPTSALAPAADNAPGRTLSLSCHVSRPAGSYAPSAGSSSTCPACPRGFAVADDGNSACDVCAPGTYSDTEGLLTCKE